MGYRCRKTELLLTDEHKEKISRGVKKAFTNEVRKKLSKSHKGKSSGMKGKHHSEESKKQMSISRSGKSSGMKGKYNHPKTSKKVTQHSLDGELIAIYNSISEAARQGFNAAHICACCLGKLKQHKGYTWRYI